MNIRRYYSPGQIVFITQIVKNRRKIFSNPEMIDLLKDKFRIVKEVHPFEMLSYAFLPDHFHILIKPSCDSNFSQIMHSVKFRFTVAYKKKMNYSGQVNCWQRRFWDHVIRNDIDFENHIHYIHHNPVKHGYVKEPHEWRNSSYEIWQKRGVYDQVVGWSEPTGEVWGE